LIRASGIAVLVALLGAQCALAQIRILPAAPQAGETVAVLAGTPPVAVVGGVLRCDAVFVTATVSGSAISLVYPRDTNPVSPAWCRLGTVVGAADAGDYTLSIPAIPNLNSGNFFPATSIPLHVSPASISAPAFTALDGHWFDPASPGVAVNLVQGDSGALFAVWLTYRSSGLRAEDTAAGTANAWYVVPSGRWTARDSFRGLLYGASGNPPGDPYVPASNAVYPAGDATFTFQDRTHMSVVIHHVTAEGLWLERQLSLQRFDF
jgi:hypothetical protein